MSYKQVGGHVPPVTTVCQEHSSTRAHSGTPAAAHDQLKRGGGGTIRAGAGLRPDQVLDSTPALGDLRYARAVTSLSGI